MCQMIASNVRETTHDTSASNVSSTSPFAGQASLRWGVEGGVWFCLKIREQGREQGHRQKKSHLRNPAGTVADPAFSLRS